MAPFASLSLGVASGLYLLASVLYQGHYWRRLAALVPYARPVTIAALSVHTLGLVLHGIQTGRLPLASVWESLSVFAWLTVLVYLVIERRGRLAAVGAFAVPLAFLAILSAGLAVPHAHPAPASALPWLLVTHALPSVLSYVAFLLAFCGGLLYLAQAWLLKAKRMTGLQRALPSLEQLDHFAYRLVALGFPLLTLGIVTGAIWFGATRGSYWGWLLQEMWPLMTWLVYAIYLHARLVAGWNRGRTMWLLVAGFAIVVVTYVVAHPTLPGVHNPLLGDAA